MESNTLSGIVQVKKENWAETLKTARREYPNCFINKDETAININGLVMIPSDEEKIYKIVELKN